MSEADGDAGGGAPLIDATGDVAIGRVVQQARRGLAEAGAVRLRIADPDAGAGLWPGERRGDGSRHRSWRAWADLADELGARMGTPRAHAHGTLEVRFTRLPPEEPLTSAGGGAGDAPGVGAPEGEVPEGERYGNRSAFARLSKLEHPGFLLPLLDALEFARPTDGDRVLVLGCHRGDEIEALRFMDPPPVAVRITGIDVAREALTEARIRFPQARFLQADVNELPSDLGRFGLIIAIGLLQSPRVDDRRLVRRLVQDHAAPTSGMILGFPNGRFRGGEAVFGARTRNHREMDLSLVVKDLAHHRRYLHQHGYRTRITGRYDLLLTARRSTGSRDSEGDGARAGMMGS